MVETVAEIEVSVVAVVDDVVAAVADDDSDHTNLRVDFHSINEDYEAAGSQTMNYVSFVTSPQIFLKEWNWPCIWQPYASIPQP